MRKKENYLYNCLKFKKNIFSKRLFCITSYHKLIKKTIFRSLLESQLQQILKYIQIQSLPMNSQFIKKAIIVNSILVVYFLTSNLSSFFGIVLTIGMFSTAGLMGFLSKKPEEQHKPDDWLFNADFVQKKYNQFLNVSLAKQISTLVGLYVITKITWFIPTWILLLIIGQTFVFWEILKENNVFSMIEGYVKLAKQSIEKVVNLIPKYQSEASN